MGGFGSGGARVGSGPKRRSMAERALTNSRLRPPRFDEDDDAPPPPSVVLYPPADLTAAHRQLWHRLASQLTLTPADAETFADYVRCNYWIAETHRRTVAAWKRGNMRLARRLDAQLRGWMQVKKRLARALDLPARGKADTRWPRA